MNKTRVVASNDRAQCMGGVPETEDATVGLGMRPFAKKGHRLIPVTAKLSKEFRWSNTTQSVFFKIQSG